MSSTKVDRPPLAFPPGFKADRILKFQFTSLSGNSNKWYEYHIADQTDHLNRIRVIARYGRVGDQGAQHDYGLIYRSDLEAMINERTRPLPRGKGYSPVDLHAIATPTSGGIDVTTPEGKLAEIIVREAGEAINSFLATTVDKLSQRQINEARSKLTAIRNFSSARFGGIADAYTLEKMVEDYYRLIPTQLPRRIDKADIVADFRKAASLDEQEVRLQQLEGAIASIVAADNDGIGGVSVDTLLGATIRALDKGSQEYRSLEGLVKGGAGNIVHDLAIYSVLIPAERAAFKARKVAPGTTQLLFHGTRNQYVRHILRKGLIVPPHAPNGRALGNGIYFANKFSKSRNYIRASGSNPGMVFISEVALGKTYRGSRTGPVPGYDSVLSPSGGMWPYDEICIYRTEQSTVRYLVTCRA